MIFLVFDINDSDFGPAKPESTKDETAIIPKIESDNSPPVFSRQWYHNAETILRTLFLCLFSLTAPSKSGIPFQYEIVWQIFICHLMSSL
jgi:hypothetical protein